jgi:hypothetical protein
MAAKLTILTHKIAIQLHLVAENYTICSSRSRRPVRILLDTPSYSFAPRGIGTHEASLECFKILRPLLGTAIMIDCDK